MTMSGESAFDRLVAAVTGAHVPEPVRQRFESEPVDPRPGQLWRARWVDVVEIVLLVEVNSDGVLAVPMSLDDAFADPEPLIVPATLTALDTPVAAWTGLAVRLPMCVLDRHADSVAFDVTGPDWVASALVAGCRRGRSPGSRTAPVHEFRGRLADAMHDLSTAAWAPQGAGTLASLIAAAPVSTTDLVKRLGGQAPRVLALRRGHAAATPEEATILAPILQLTEQGVLDANPALPVDLVRLLSRPRRRAQVARLATQRRQTERRTWQSAAFSLQAARQTGASTEPAWDERIDRYFQAALEP
jgi:hypothetical protein